MSETGVSYVARNDRHEEALLFVRDTLDHEEEARFEIDAFRFARYVALGWIRPVEAFPYYQLTPNGEEVYWSIVDPDWWDDDEDDDDED